jgi:serine/threonine protein phosphatase PrpC
MSISFGSATLGDREQQEDAFVIVSQSDTDPNRDILMIVADGMGGHVGGEVASNLAIQKFETHFISNSKTPKPRDRLLAAAHAANQSIADSITSDPGMAGMGCTLVGALKLNDRLAWVSIGDSHVYLFRDGTLNKLNEDHSVYGELMVMVKEGKLTPAEAAANPKRNALRSALIGQPLTLIDLNSAVLQHGDLIVIATDGLDSLEPSKITQVLNDHNRDEVEHITEALLDAVRVKGRKNQDNTTIVSYRHIQAGRSMWADDSKWKIAGSADKFSSPMLSPVAKYIAIISGIAILALLVVFLALPSRTVAPPMVDPKPSATRSASPITDGEIPSDTTNGEVQIGGDDVEEQSETNNGSEDSTDAPAPIDLEIPEEATPATDPLQQDTDISAVDG